MTAGEVTEVVGFAVRRATPLVVGRCTFVPTDVDSHPGVSAELLVVVDPESMATTRDEVVARTGVNPRRATVEGATAAYQLRLGVVGQVGAVDSIGGVIVTVADPGRTPAQAVAAAVELAGLALR